MDWANNLPQPERRGPKKMSVALILKRLQFEVAKLQKEK